MDFKIEMSEKFLETFGTGTLLGTILNQAEQSAGKTVDAYNALPNSKVTLVFPQTSLNWKRKNGGPNQIIIDEHVLMCVVSDVIKLRAMGVEVSLETLTRDPE